MKMRTGKVKATPDLLFKGDKRDSVARVLEDDEIRQIEQAKDPAEALTKALDDAHADVGEDDELEDDKSVHSAAERDRI